MNLSTLDTPALLLEEARFARNVERVHAAVRRHPGVTLRPHFKTAKSIEALERIFLANRRATVSTINEAQYLCRHGVRDLLYAVGIAPGKLDRIAQLQREGATVAVVLDDLESARALAAWAAATSRSDAAFRPLRVMIEIDTDRHRAGVEPQSERLIAIAQALDRAPGIEFAGVMTHAGASYDCRSIEDIARVAELERSGAVTAAERIRGAGIRCPEVSVGSTPTILFAQQLTGVTEARVGVAYFNDLTMVGLGVCSLDDIALSVLTTVIGHQTARNRVLVDAGWMALSADRGRASQLVFPGYGLIADLEGRPLSGIGIVETNQEHGLIGATNGTPLDFTRFPLGGRLRILPNHACATAAAFSHYQVLDARGGLDVQWARCSGW